MDNGKDKIGTFVEEKPVISVVKLKDLYESSADNYEIVITIGVSRWAMFAVVNQPKNIGIDTSSIYNDIKRRWNNRLAFVKSYLYTLKSKWN